jgi:DNA-binding CsgD family transcriptional regulator
MAERSRWAGTLLGRDRELEGLDEIARRALDRSQSVLIEGPAGIGKSTLANRMQAIAADAGFALRTAAADPLEGDRPFGAVFDALGLYSFPGEGTGGSPPSLFSLAADGRYQVMELLCAHVEQQCSAGPLAVFIEDVHYADASVPLILRKLRQRLSAHPLLIVTSSRPETLDPETQRVLTFLRSEADLHVSLPPLSAHDSTALALRSLGGSQLGPRLSSLIEAAHGNPLMIVGVTTGLERESALEFSGESVDMTDGALRSVPATFAEQVRRTCGLLSSAAGELIRAAAVLGDPFTLDDLATVIGARATLLSRAMREAAASGLLVSNNANLTFRHDLVRAAVLDGMDRSERAWLHERSAEVLAERGVSTALVAAHLDAAGSASDDAIRHWFRRAALEASPRSPSTAQRLYARALAVTPPGHPDHGALAVAQLGEMAAAGMFAEAERIGRELLSEDLPADIGSSASWWLGGILFLRNQMSDAAATFDDAADRLHGTPQGSQCRAMAAMCHLTALDDHAGDAVDQAMRDAASTNDAVATTLACMAGSRVASAELRTDDARALVQRAIDVADADPTHEAHRYQPHFIAGMLMYDFGNAEQLLHHVTAGRQRCREIGTTWAEALYHGQAASGFYLAGRLDDALVEALAGKEVADDVGVNMMLLWCVSVAAMVSVHRGELDQARAHIERGRAELGTVSGQLGVELLALAESRLMSIDDIGSAHAHIVSSWEFLSLLKHPPIQFALASETARLALLADDRDMLERVAADVRRWSAHRSMAWMGWIADVCEAVVRKRDPTQALGAARRAPRLDVALMAGALAHRSTSESERAVLVRTAESTFRDVGAYGDLERSRARFTEVQRRGRPRTRAVDGWGALTHTELRVVDRLVSGSSNRDIADDLGMALRTVETHVSHVLQKLSVQSRLGIVAAARERDPRTGPLPVV